MAEYNGTVFLYAHSNEFEKEAFSQAAKDAGRTLIKQGDNKGLDPVGLAESAGKNAFIVPPSMMRFLDIYISSCSLDQRHLAVFLMRRSNSKLFMDFLRSRRWISIVFLLMMPASLNKGSHAVSLAPAARWSQADGLLKPAFLRPALLKAALLKPWLHAKPEIILLPFSSRHLKRKAVHLYETNAPRFPLQ